MKLIAQIITETLAHIGACEAVLNDERQSPEHASHRGAVSRSALCALDHLRKCIVALQPGAGDIEAHTEALEPWLDAMHDMASDIVANAQKRMEEPAYDPHADWRKHEGIAA